MDPSLDVINVLKQFLEHSYITIPDSIKIHHERGQNIKLSTGPKCIFIAGMGGKEIRDIIESVTPQMNSQDRLVISPHRYLFELRQFLHSSQWHLHQEALVKENRQYYQILSLEMNPALPKVHFFGDQIWNSPFGLEYRDHLLRTFSLHKDTLSLSLVDYLKQLSC